MRRILDSVYAGGLIAACAAMVTIAVLVMVQVLGRIIDRAVILVGLEPPGISVPSLSEFGGFLFVAAACLALPATLRAGVHVRVTLALGLMGPRLGRALAALVLLAAIGLSAFATWHSIEQARDSWVFGTVAFGMLPVPLWLPQGVMGAGFALLLLALADELATLMRGSEPAFRRAEAGRQDNQAEGGH
ncbi:MAG: TRAP-type C4-dicarboxylate transport system, small permease component [Rhodobacteraceae bacterium HLUCCA12]|nr:MAG: TRAP-type C4-dicarboxylate transport system, small permease component [Rhodobacteraceae bacterium HLUCCA12]